MKVVKNLGYTKPTKEEMATAMKEAEQRRKDIKLNREDQLKDSKDKADMETYKVTKAYEGFMDNFKELLYFMDNNNMSDIECFDIHDNMVSYSFANYKLYGSTKEENTKKLLDENKDFMMLNGIKEYNLKNPNEDFRSILDLSKHLAIETKEERDKICRLLYKIADKAKILKMDYQSVVDNRFFVPEFLIQLPEDKLDTYIYLHMVNANLCDGIRTPESIPEEIHNRLHWKYYPIIMIDPALKIDTRNRIQGSLSFMNQHNEYFF